MPEKNIFGKNLKQDQTAILSIARRINNILSVCCTMLKFLATSDGGVTVYLEL